jgi:hypothetical protein
MVAIEDELERHPLILESSNNRARCAMVDWGHSVEGMGQDGRASLKSTLGKLISRRSVSYSNAHSLGNKSFNPS